MVAACILANARSCNCQCSCDLYSKHGHISLKTHLKSTVQASPRATTSLTLPFSKKGCGMHSHKNISLGNTFRIILPIESDAKYIHTKKSPQGPESARIPRPRSGALSVKFTFVWAVVLNCIILECTTETIEFPYMYIIVV